MIRIVVTQATVIVVNNLINRVINLVDQQEFVYLFLILGYGEFHFGVVDHVD